MRVLASPLLLSFSHSYALRLFRSETINPHGLYDTLFSHIKDAKQHSKLKVHLPAERSSQPP